jgi:hypothetical protein
MDWHQLFSYRPLKSMTQIAFKIIQRYTRSQIGTQINHRKPNDWQLFECKSDPRFRRALRIGRSKVDQKVIRSWRWEADWSDSCWVTFSIVYRLKKWNCGRTGQQDWCRRIADTLMDRACLSPVTRGLEHILVLRATNWDILISYAAKWDSGHLESEKKIRFVECPRGEGTPVNLTPCIPRVLPSSRYIWRTAGFAICNQGQTARNGLKDLSSELFRTSPWKSIRE